MTRAKAIKERCFECSGGSAKEVTLCQVFDCALWEYRTGSRISSSIYKRRIKAAFRNYEADLKEMEREGVDLAVFRAQGRAISKSRRKRKLVTIQTQRTEKELERGLF